MREHPVASDIHRRAAGYARGEAECRQRQVRIGTGREIAVIEKLQGATSEQRAEKDRIASYHQGREHQERPVEEVTPREMQGREPACIAARATTRARCRDAHARSPTSGCASGHSAST